MNGLLTNYIIVIGQMIRIQISNTSLNSLVVSDLTPFTVYDVSIIACTDGGCTESPHTTVKTDAANPEGLQPPLATPISPNYLSLSWIKPSKPNGPISNYELLRMIMAQPLIDNPVGLGMWFSVYSGDHLTFDDTNLDTFTTYVYRLEFSNGYGRVMSPNSPNVTTFSGIPKQLPEIKVSLVNFPVIRLSWEIPDIKLIQGRVDIIKILIFNKNNTNSTEPVYSNILTRPNNASDELPSHVDLTNLRPLTFYWVTMAFTLYGGETYNVEDIHFTTPDEALEDLSPPTFNVISDWSIQIFWEEPKTTKGQIVAYYILLNNNKIDPNTSHSGSYIMDNLIPYTVYNISIEACTRYSCITSRPSFMTTSESAPESMNPPKVEEVKGQKFIRVTWDPPERQNGIILVYELFKKQTYENCVSNSPVSEEKCKYVICDTLQAACGDQCYSGYMMCCNGRLSTIQDGYECCGTAYIPRRKNESDICCGGKFHTKMANFRCCSGWYVEVLPGQICCKDPNEDRVVVDYGDACCEYLPYDRKGSQLCCGGRMHSKLSNQCCGNKIINSSMACCHGNQEFVLNGNDQTLTIDGVSYKWYASQEGFSCCGLDYVSSSTNICCTDQSGRWKIHRSNNISQSALSLFGVVEKCCGLNLISDSLECCGEFSYNSQQQVCADVDENGQYSGCGQGKICLRTATNQTAACGVCEFDWLKNRCFTSHKLQPIKEDDDIGNINLLLENRCFGPSVLIYSGLNLSFQDANIEHFTNYSYYVIAINSAGITTSNSTLITTLPGIPQGVSPPDVQTNPDNPFYVFLTWKPPKIPNGFILWYAIMRDSFEISRISMSSSPPKYTYLDDKAVVPLRIYKYFIQACTTEGCNNSNEVSVMTKQGTPDPFGLPIIKTINSTSLEIKWINPVKTNGFVTHYVVKMVRPERRDINIVLENVYVGDRGLSSNHTHIVADLSPFTNYTFTLSICTEAGCTSSNTFSGVTATAIPSDMLSPLLLYGGSTPLVEVSWLPPASPGGVLIELGLERSSGGLSFEKIMVALTISTEVTYNDTNVVLGNQYKYRVYFTNSAGTKYSQESSIIIPNSVPDVTCKLTNASVLSDTSIAIAWSVGTNKNTAVYSGSFNLLVISDCIIYTLTTIAMTPNTDKYTHNIRRLKPYTLYTIRIQACFSNSDNCGTSPSQAKLRTNPAAPFDQAPPSVKSLDPYSIQIWWGPPSQPNGPIKTYMLYRSEKMVSNQSFNSSRLSNPGIFPTEILVANLPPNVTEYRDSGQDILPNKMYYYRLVVVGVVGEISSNYTEVRTLEAPPEVQVEPEITFVSSVEAGTCWRPPLRTNGFIIHYVLMFKRIFPHGDKQNDSAPIYVRLDGTILCTNMTGLIPYSNYTTRITATNSAGSVSSDWSSSIKTYESSPSGVEPPTFEPIIGGRSVLLTWREPARTNGVITHYIVYLKNATTNSNSTEYQGISTFNIIYKDFNQQYEVGNLEPYSRYISILEVCTSVGCSRSHRREFITSPAVPPNPPEVKRQPLTSASSVVMEWTIPSVTYGPISKLEVFRSNSSMSSAIIFTNETERSRVKRSIEEEIFELIYVMDISDSSDIQTFTYNDTTILPFFIYKYFLRMYNKAGYIDSPKIEATTPEAPPTFVAPPTVDLIPFQFDKLLITWSSPANPNGIIQSYQLNRSGLQIPWHFLPNSTLRFVDSGLMAYTVYLYTITACTNGGCTTSEQTSQRTSETAPDVVESPQIIKTTPTSLTVNWDMPRLTNGQIIKYELKLNSKSIYSGLNTSYEISDLTPYTFYSLSLVACTSGSCTESVAVTSTTDQTEPDSLASPELVVMNANEIKVSWKSPNRPNGPMVLFELRSNGSLIDIVTPEKVADNESTSFSVNYKTWTYMDRNLFPATTYSYIVTAYNPIGKVSSQPSLATTPASAPIGVSPPTLEAISSTTILASWNPPLISNGEITSYGLFLSLCDTCIDSSLPRSRKKRDIQSESPSQSSRLVYIGLDLFTRVTGLQPFSNYSMSLQTCTSEGCSMSEESFARTLASIPENQRPPQLTPFSNLNNSQVELLPEVGVEVTWLPPDKTNGVILQYMLFRRFLDNQANENSNEKLLYAGKNLHFIDLDPDLLPYTFYQYKIFVVNSVGSSSSDWQIVQTSEGRPTGIVGPVVQNTSSRGAVITQDPPLHPNGNIINYTLFLDNQPKLISSQSQFFVLGLNPATKYNLRIEMCNKIACASSPTSELTTNGEPPQGSFKPGISNVTSDSLLVSWHEPASKNGLNLSYQISYRTTCPRPYSLDINKQPIGYNCENGSFLIGYNGPAREIHLTNLIPYTKYNLELITCNEAGCSNETTHADVTTLTDVPQYKQGHPPTIRRRQNYLTINWSKSFNPNGPIRYFSFFKEGLLQFSGPILAFVDDLQDRNISHLYKVTLTTNVGSTSSPNLLYVPHLLRLQEIDSVDFARDNITTLQTSDDEKMYYSDKWFIILIAVPCVGIFIFIIVLMIVANIKFSNKKDVPYLRESGYESSPNKLDENRGSTSGLIYQVPIDFQEYASPAFSDDWSSGRSSVVNSLARNRSPERPEELDPWRYLGENQRRSYSPSKGSVTVADVIGSNSDKAQRLNDDRLHTPDVTMPGVDEDEDDSGLQSFVENIIFKDSRGISTLPDSKI